MHNCFSWGQCYLQSVLVTYIVAHHFFGYAYHQAQLFLVTHNNSCTNLFDYIHCYTPHSCLCTLLHTTFFGWAQCYSQFFGYIHHYTQLFLLRIYIIAHIFFVVVHNVMHNTFFGCSHHHAQLLLVMHIVTHNFFVMIYTMKNNMVLFCCIVLQLT